MNGNIDKLCTTGLLAKLDIYEAYAPIRNVQIVMITTIVILVTLGVMASLGLAKVTIYIFWTFFHPPLSILLDQNAYHY